MPKSRSELRSVVDALTAREVPGISVAVVRSGAIEAIECAGESDLASHMPATAQSVYLWFSMTKIVTATAVMQLAEREMLDLDDPVERFVPAFPSPRSGWPPVRVRHLLSHSAGLANPIPIRWVHPAGEPGRDQHRFATELLRKHHRLRYPAGSKAAYSNLGYIALGEVIAAAAGRSYEDYVRGEILEPLSMKRTGFGYSVAGGRDIATGYQRRLSPMTPLFRLLLPRGIVGAPAGRFLAFNPFHVDGPAYGGLVGSVADAARFMAAHLRGGEFDGVRLLSRASVERMQTIQASGRKIDVGLGWYRRGPHRADADLWEHLGGGGGFWSMMRLHPKGGAGVVAMGNATRYDHEAIAEAEGWAQEPGAERSPK